MANTRAKKTAQNLSTLTTAGDIAYASAAGTPTRLGIGSSAQVLTVASGVPSWATPTASALTKILATTFSGVSSYSAPAATFSATYDNYKIVVELTGASASTSFFMRARVGGVDYASGGYTVQEISGITTTAAAASTAGTEWALSTINTNTRYLLNMEWFKPFGTGQHLAVGQIFNNNSSGNLGYRGFGSRIDTGTSYDAFTIYPSTGTITGSVAVYGYSL